MITEEYTLRILEYKVYKELFGLRNEEGRGGVRKCQNEELHNL
jgi:hypothetical protein